MKALILLKFLKFFKTIVHAPLFEGAMEASGGVDFNGFKGGRWTNLIK